MIGDFFRFWWSLFHLNLRQAAFRRRGCRGRSPCQAPSDSGAAWQTHCEVSLSWNRPDRLRHVCPHLRPTPAGWRCSVDTAAIRPHWGRAFAFVSGALLACYLAAGLAAFAVFSARGFPGLSPLDTLWPGRWSHVTAARSTVFLTRASAAISSGDIRSARLHLASAAVTAGENYEVRLALAQTYSYLSEEQPATAAFRELYAGFPAHRARTAVAYHDAMIALRAFDALGDFAAERLAEPDAPERSTWYRAYLVALRGSRAPSALHARHTAALAGLPAPWRDLLAAEAALRAGDRSALPPLLGLTPDPADSFLLIGAAETLADFAEAPAALDEILRLAPALGSFERDRLLLRVNLRAGAEAAALRRFDAMLRAASEPPQRERLLASLVEFPDPVRARRFLAAVSNSRMPFSPAELGSLWVAAALAPAEDLRQLVAARLAAEHGTVAPAGLAAAPGPTQTSLWLRTLPVGREVAWALALRFAPARPPPR